MDYMFESQKITTTTTTRSLPCIISMYNMQFIKQKREIYNQKLQKLWKTFSLLLLLNYQFLSLERNKSLSGKDIFNSCFCLGDVTWDHGSYWTTFPSWLFWGKPQQEGKWSCCELAIGAHMVPTPVPSETPSFPWKGQRPCQYPHIIGMIDHNSFFWAVSVCRVHAYSGSPQCTDHWHGTT